MCGLIGVMGFVGAKEKKVLHDLMQVDVLRGKHSTGIATVGLTNNVEVVKRAMNPIDFYDMKPVCTALAKSLNCVIGHNRYATKGAVNNVNAHPFEFSHVVGAHNGTLHSTWGLEGHNIFEVDSECLYNHINIKGVDDAFQKASGAFALTWYDSDTKNLHFLRNDKRPMCYCYSADYATLFWASEAWMLHGMLIRNGIEYTDIVVTREDTLYTFAVPTGTVLVKDKLSAPKVRKLIKKYNPVKKPNSSALSCITGGKTHPSTTTNTTTKESLRELMLPYVNKVVDVHVIKRSKDANQQFFIECGLADDYDITVRCYVLKDSSLWHLMTASVQAFSMLIRSYKTYLGDEYLLADLRSIKEVPFDLGEEEAAVCGDITVEGYDGERLLYKEFVQATNEGCSWCTGNAEFGKPTHFTNRFDFFCHACLKDKECLEFLGIGEN
tara:strand:+ start:28320 stop:29636 length:1317 start_codon:yes stop_codon:yes gene_type:complete